MDLIRQATKTVIALAEILSHILFAVILSSAIIYKISTSAILFICTIFDLT